MKDQQPTILVSVLNLNQAICDRFNDLGIGIELSAFSPPQPRRGSPSTSPQKNTKGSQKPQGPIEVKTKEAFYH
jgi:hypothetical protein